MNYRSLRGSLLSFSTVKIRGLVTPGVTNSKPSTLTQPSTSLNIPGDSNHQMARKKNDNRPKGIKRKGPKRASLDRSQLSQGDQVRAMGYRSNDYQSDQARERLESAAWSQYHSQQQGSYHSPSQQQQQSLYQPPTWQQPLQQTSSNPGGRGPPGMANNLNPESTSFTPPPWGTARWTPHQIPPPPQLPHGDVSQHWAQTVSAPANSCSTATTASSGNNTPYYFDLTGSRNTHNTPYPASPNRRGYSTLSNNNGDRQGEGNSTPRQNPGTIYPPVARKDNNNNPRHKRKGGEKAHLRINETRDDISPPSAASGGVPDPDPNYLLRASFLPQPTPGGAPRPILVVIDLNGTMLFRPSRKNPHQFVARPNAKRFLSYCIETFNVVIWSSARPANVKTMCEKLLTKQQLDSVVAIWGRDKFGLTSEDYNKRTQCYKRLTRLWGDPKIAAAHPDGEPWNQGNTVLIDDSMEKARSEPYNAITLPEFLGDTREEPAVLPMVHDYLNILAVQADISSYIRMHPFKLDNQTDAAAAAPAEVLSLVVGAAAESIKASAQVREE